MNTETEDEIYTTGNRKVNVGVKVHGELKNDLIKEADDLGISLSEYSENILINRKNTDCEELEAEVEVLKEEVENKNELLNISAKSLQKAKAEVKELERKLAIQSEQLGLFENKRLLELLAKAKGRKDEVELPDGQKLQITYNTAKDVLTALIYAYNL